MTVPLDEAVPVDPPQRRRPRLGGDPVKVLLHRHRELCEHAVDCLEIAAGLEAHGITDRTAARFRHRDVFSLAEELYARTPRAQTPPAPPAGIPVDPRAVRGFGRALLPGALALAAAAAGVPWAGALAAAATVAVPLAVLLFLTRLMLGHGAPRGALAGALALVLALLPVPAAPFAAAAGLLVPAVLALSRASAHARRP
ncbi:hypothetical protein [Streptomyces sp. NPDC059411]|uniref:hypothetical protein n=1 Tax=Streptomyces sp. NPDC059411 TaxID=3346825 RepID=UPI00368240A4